MKNVRTLIIANDPLSMDTLVEALNESVGEISRAANMQDGLALAESIQPDLVTVDLPPVQGREVCRGLRAAPTTANVVVVLLSTSSAEFDQLRGFEAGADSYWTKPVCSRVLEARGGVGRSGEIRCVLGVGWQLGGKRA